MQSAIRRALITVAAATSLLTASPTAQRPLEIVAFKIEALKNSVDGTALRGCLARTDITVGRAHAAWIAFGVVKPGVNGAWGAWEAISSRTECGSGTFDGTGAKIVRALGPPYLILDLVVDPKRTEGRVHLATSVIVRTLTAFQADGRPTYTTARSKIVHDLAATAVLVSPLFQASPRERDAFGISELLVRLTARSVESNSPVSYGAVSVTADVPGIDILLDGGVVGRTGHAPQVLAYVTVGSHEVLVRDYSGREAHQAVVVRMGQTVEVALSVLKLPVKGRELSPIGKNPQGSDEFWRAQDGATMLRVPAGEFLMGSAEGKGEAHERPQHRATTGEFLIDKTEVTWRQFRTFAKATQAVLPPEPIWGAPDEYPVVNVQWAQANAFCEWVGGRLPTETEWEKAARGTDGREFPYGDVLDIDRCNTEDGGPHRPLPVGSYASCVSPYGAVDMAGSAREWCADWYVRGYAHKISPPSSGAPDTSRGRVIRGGGWMNMYPYQRAASRFGYDPDGRSEHVGFRCARDTVK